MYACNLTVTRPLIVSLTCKNSLSYNFRYHFRFLRSNVPVTNRENRASVYKGICLMILTMKSSVLRWADLGGHSFREGQSRYCVLTFIVLVFINVSYFWAVLSIKMHNDTCHHRFVLSLHNLPCLRIWKGNFRWEPNYLKLVDEHLQSLLTEFF